MIPLGDINYDGHDAGKYDYPGRTEFQWQYEDDYSDDDDDDLYVYYDGHETYLCRGVERVDVDHVTAKVTRYSQELDYNYYDGHDGRRPAYGAAGTGPPTRDDIVAEVDRIQQRRRMASSQTASTAAAASNSKSDRTAGERRLSPDTRRNNDVIREGLVSVESDKTTAAKRTADGDRERTVQANNRLQQQTRRSQQKQNVVTSKKSPKIERVNVDKIPGS